MILDSEKEEEWTQVEDCHRIQLTIVYSVSSNKKLLTHSSRLNPQQGYISRLETQLVFSSRNPHVRSQEGSYQELVYLGLSIRRKDVGFEIIVRNHVVT
jgi:hypothetical protein